MFLLLIPICFIASVFFFITSVIVLFGVCYCIYDEETEIDLAPQNEKTNNQTYNGNNYCNESREANQTKYREEVIGTKERRNEDNQAKYSEEVIGTKERRNEDNQAKYSEEVIGNKERYAEQVDNQVREEKKKKKRRKHKKTWKIGIKTGIKTGTETEQQKIYSWMKLYTVHSNGISIPLDEHFTCPARYFFKLHFKSTFSKWISAITLKAYGGSGECERLALIGDSLLDQFTIEIICFEHPDFSAHQIHQMKQRYTTNEQLGQSFPWIHFSKMLNRELSNKQTATLIEALLATTDEVYNRKLTKALVQQMMDLIDGKINPPLVCGTPVFHEESVVGMISCVKSGVTFREQQVLEKIK